MTDTVTPQRGPGAHGGADGRWAARVWDAGDVLVWVEYFASENSAESYRVSVEARKQGYLVTIEREVGGDER
jgi:hypothetical protein